MRVLLATGGSLHSKAALQLGLQILRECDDPPTILAVVQQEANRPRAKQILANARDMLTPKMTNMRTLIRVGQPYKEIHREAKQGTYDLLVLGERRYHRLRTRFRGSVVMRIVSHAPCSVLVAKGKIAPLKRILICDSGVAPTSVLKRFVQQGLVDLLAPEAEITILHVMSQISVGPNVGAEWQLYADASELIRQHAPEGEFLTQDLHLLEPYDVRVQPKVRHGPVVNEIVSEAESGDYNLVVIGIHRQEYWNYLLLQDLAHQIMTQLNQPVLLVR